MLKQLISFNIQVNHHLNALNRDRQRFYVIYSDKSICNNIQKSSEKVILCNSKPNANLKVANALVRHSKLAGDGRIQNGNVDK